ncbi:Sodium hydrogen exchanger 7 [Micractinium conductrix]|uniref:Sodium hydrogen exchanger 7 n=1 Tax=Micractinium conductrix TaxID=554055 RepID=A0A2P6V788_9CHLO|nr:Sodium hydrogen exchanger 7 [Micractinium conductrix]|eukprot:PSC69954.1 Sodium hydrogen exchanger 7 [Micractinium conductrix]
MAAWAARAVAAAAHAADTCANATYEQRIDDPSTFNFCSVPGGGADAFLFAALAVLVACCLHFSSLSAVFVLVAGALAEGFVFPFNLGRLGNAFTLWLGIDPPEIFFYAFLPPLLLDSALSIDFFLFRKVMLQVFCFAFLVVLLSTLLTTPLLLHDLGLAAHGWRWQHGALFSAMLASTAVLRRAGGPEALVTLMEGESLLNDASGIVLFEQFHRLVQQLPSAAAAANGAPVPSPLSVLPMLTWHIAVLAAGGVAVGLAAGWATTRLLRLLRWYGASAAQQVALILAGAYLSFYLANAPLAVSGVTSVVVYGLYGNSVAHFELEASRHMRELEAVQNTVAFALNGIVFYFAGASSVNFAIRAVEGLADYGRAFAMFPPIYILLFAIRGLCIALFNPLFSLVGRQSLSPRAVMFATWGGLRGAISLIMAQVIVTDESFAAQGGLVAAQMGLWTGLFVLSTLLVNAPTIPALLRFTRLNQVSLVKLRIREKAKRALLRYTATAIQDLKADEDEMLRGVDWAAVARYVDLSEELHLFDSSTSAAGSAGAGAGAQAGGGSGGGGPATAPSGPAALVGRTSSGRAASGPASTASLGSFQSSEQMQRENGLFGSAGWAEPSSTCVGTPSSRRAAALAGLSKLPGSPSSLNSSRRLLGASYARLTHKWEPRLASAGEEEGERVAGGEGEGEGEGEGGAALAAAAAPRIWKRLCCLQRTCGAGSGSGASRLSKYGSGEFAHEAPFWSGRGGAPASPMQGGGLGLAGAKSAPLLHSIVEVMSSSEEEGASSDEEPGSSASESGGRTRQQAPPQQQFHLLPAEDSVLAAGAALSADAASAPTSPRGVMHGLVRTSLLPAAADRQAVQQVSELMDGEGDGGGGGSAAAGAAGSGPSAAFSSWSTQPPSPAMTPRTAAQITPRTAAQLAASGLSAAAVAPSEPSSPAFTPRTAGLLASLGGGPRPLRHTASGSTSSSGGGSRLGGGAGRPATARCVGGGFGGGLAAGSRPAHAGLAVLFKPPSPGKISPLPSAGASPEPSELPAVAEGPSEPPDEPTAAEALGFGRGLQEEAAAAAAQCVDAAAAAAVPGSQRARQQAQRAPAAAALEQAVPLAPLDSFPSPSGRLGELVSAEEAAELGPFTAAGTAGVAHEAGATEEAGPAAAAQPQGAVSSPGRSRSLALPPLVHELLSPLDLPPTVEAEEGSTHGSAAAPATALPPAAMAAALTGAGIKPWQAGALLLRRSMSSPLTGIAGQLEAAEHQAAAGQGAGKGCAGGGAAGAGQAAPGMPGVGVGGPGGGQMSDEVLAEVRLRLVAGLKRYFHSKRGAGLLSSQGLRILDFACDRAMDCPHRPLDIWSVAEREAVGKYLVKALAWLFFRTKRLTGALPRWLRWPLMPLLRWFSGLIGGVLSSTMLVATECAVEAWLALAWSPQAQWLRESERAGPLQAEIAAESARVCRFIVDREIEAPERFQAIQSYRAAMAILRQQGAFIEQLYSSGVVNEAERAAMQEPVERRGRQLEIQGPVWRAPSVREVLRGLPFLAHVPEPVFDALLERGTLLEYTQGDLIWEGSAPAGGGKRAGKARREGGLHIVVYGLVRSSFTDHRGVTHDYYLGSGGVVGLMGALRGRPMAGSGPAVAEANALHKGPVVFHIPQAVIRRIRQHAAAGDQASAQLEVDLFRVCGLYVLERIKGEVLAAVVAEYERLAGDRARRAAIHRAAAAAAGRGAAAASHGGGAPQLPAAVPLSNAEALRLLDAGRLRRSSHAFARHLLADMRQLLRDAELLQLAPRQAHRQRGHLLLMQGSLARGSGAAAAAGQPMSAPAVLPWLAGHMQSGPAASANVSTVLPVSAAAAAAAASAPPLVADGGGALLLVCPEEAQPSPTPSSAASTAELSPFAAGRPGISWGPGEDSEEEAAPRLERQRAQRTQQEQVQQEDQQQQQQQEAAVAPQQGRLEPVGGRPLHRVRSRRLPAAPGALLSMEAGP